MSFRMIIDIQQLAKGNWQSGKDNTMQEQDTQNCVIDLAPQEQRIYGHAIFEICSILRTVAGFCSRPATWRSADFSRPLSPDIGRTFSTPVRDRFVYITHGMSATPMRVPAEVARLYPAKIELIAYCREAYIGAQDGQDMVSACLQALAVVPFEMDIFFGPMHTAAMEGSFGPNPEMTAFFFAVPDGVEMRRLCSCTPAAEL